MRKITRAQRITYSYGIQQKHEVLDAKELTALNAQIKNDLCESRQPIIASYPPQAILRLGDGRKFIIEQEA